MSIFASRVQRTIDIPFGDRQADGSAHTVTIQKLSGKQLERAREAGQRAMVDMLNRLGGVEVQRELSAIGDAAKQADLIAKAQADPLNQFDRTDLINRGIQRWTYDVEITPATIEDLSEEAADFIAREIVALTLPSQDAASRKNDLRPSTGVWTVKAPSHSSTTLVG